MVSQGIYRRIFLGSLTAGYLSAVTAPSRYTVGITTNTRGGWENDVILSFREAKLAGFTHVESFFHYFHSLVDQPEKLLETMGSIGVRIVTISNGAPMEMHFEDPAQHTKIVNEHIRLVRFNKKLGARHLKINMGPRRPEGTTAADLKHMASVLDQIGKATSAEGLRLAVHAHMWSQFETLSEIEYVMGHTDPKHVFFVLDTGHINMAGMDPIALAKQLGHRIVEFHLKDVSPLHKNGAKQRVAVHEPMTKPIFFPLGEGGVDFPALKVHLDQIQWKGFLTVELDSSPFRPPLESAKTSAKYLKSVLGLSF